MQAQPVNLDLLRRTTRADFYAQIGVAEQEAMYPAFTMEVPSDSDQETYSFFGAVTKPVRTDIKSGATLSGVTRDTPFKDYSMSLKNATWVYLQQVERDVIEDAKLDQIRVRAQSAADSGVSFQDERMTAVLEANGLAYEGTAYYGGTHHGVTSFAKDNDTTSAAATGVIPTVAEFEDGYALLVASMRSLTDDQGRIANTGNLGLVCMVDPTNERVARAVLEKGPVPGTTHATTSSGNTGVFQGNARVIVNPFLTNTAGDRMYLFVTAKPIKPIVYQTRIPWDFKLIVDGDDWEKHDMGALKGRSRFDYMLGDWKKGGRHVWT